MARTDQFERYPYDEASYNEHLSPVIPKALGRELVVYGEHRDRGALATIAGGLYQMDTADVSTIQLTIRPGWVVDPVTAAEFGVSATGEANAAHVLPAQKRTGTPQPALSWQVQRPAGLVGLLQRLFGRG